jgi:hypothetical protein
MYPERCTSRERVSKKCPPIWFTVETFRYFLVSIEKNPYRQTEPTMLSTSLILLVLGNRRVSNTISLVKTPWN